MAGEPPDAYLRVQTITVPVSNLERSLEFHETWLGFRIIVRQMPLVGNPRSGLVAPPHGSAILILSESDPGRLGAPTGVSFLTDDLDARHRQWSARGVQLTEALRSAPWGSKHATFLDLDRNAFTLVEADVVPAARPGTAFFGVYDDRTRRLRCVNCGHPPPLLLRRETLSPSI
jgi:catechol 2,3-dioxygenase-like lactoylglutathione lyase family enzyme